MSDIPDADLQIELWPPNGVGGQQVGVTTGVKVTHIPSGIVAFVNTNRSQHRNKNVAVDMILGALTSPHWRG
jgi:peptide chain release factor 2